MSLRDITLRLRLEVSESKKVCDIANTHINRWHRMELVIFHQYWAIYGPLVEHSKMTDDCLLCLTD